MEGHNTFIKRENLYVVTIRPFPMGPYGVEEPIFFKVKVK
jgi:hypothetical protein